MFRHWFHWLRRRPIPKPATEGTHPDPRMLEEAERLREAQARAWWRDRTGVVAETDGQLLVIQPRADASADALRALGARLREWKQSKPHARHIWGLDDLLDGRGPRTPPIYLSVPYKLDGYENHYEAVALVFVAGGTNFKAAADDLAAWLEPYLAMLASLQDPWSYSCWNR